MKIESNHLHPLTQKTRSPVPQPTLFENPLIFRIDEGRDLQSKTKISELLKSIGSELIEPRKVECTTFQLATWLTLVIENEKIFDKLSRQDAENIGSTVTATLLSKNSLKDKIISNQKDYKSQISELKDQIKDLRKTVDALLKTKHQIQSEILDMKGDGGKLMKAITTKMEKFERDRLLEKT